VTEISITSDRKEQVRLFIIMAASFTRGNNYLKIRDLLSIALFNILGTHYSIHI
jgi:hypothetical protein